ESEQAARDFLLERLRVESDRFTLTSLTFRALLCGIAVTFLLVRLPSVSLVYVAILATMLLVILWILDAARQRNITRNLEHAIGQVASSSELDNYLIPTRYRRDYLRNPLYSLALLEPVLWLMLCTFTVIARFRFF